MALATTQGPRQAQETCRVHAATPLDTLTLRYVNVASMHNNRAGLPFYMYQAVIGPGLVDLCLVNSSILSVALAV